MVRSYRSRKGEEEALGPRLRRRARREERRRRYLSFLTPLGVFLGLGIVVYGAFFAYTGLQQKRLEERVAKPVETSRTLLVIGKEAGSREAKGILVLRADLKQGKLKGVTVSPDTYATVAAPGGGSDRVGEMLGRGEDVMERSLERLLGIAIDSTLTMDQIDWKRVVERSGWSRLLSRSQQGSLPSSVKGRYEKLLAEVSESEVVVVPLPVVPLSLGGRTVYQVEPAKVSKLVQIFWGQRPPVGRFVAKVMVLNGSGQPGVAQQVAGVLGERGYDIVGTKNADNFQYSKTYVIVYGSKGPEAGKIAEILGVGEVINKDFDQDVADITVIIGKDYKLPGGG